MNRLAAILPVSNVLVNVEATSKKRAFEQAGLLFENQHAIARATVTVARLPLITEVSVAVALNVTVRVPVFGVSLAS